MAKQKDAHVGNSLRAFFTYHGMYFSIAQESLSRAVELQRELRERTSIRPVTQDDVEWISQQNDRIEQMSIVSVVFSAMTAESFINDYAIEHLSKSYLEKYLDKMDLSAKWIVIPKLVTGKSINPGSRPMELLKDLVALRNRLVHDKTRSKPINQITDSDFVSIDDAQKALETVQKVIVALSQIDDAVEVGWLGLKAAAK